MENVYKVRSSLTKILFNSYFFTLLLSVSRTLSLSVSLFKKWLFVTHLNCFILERMCSVPGDLRSSHNGLHPHVHAA